MRGWKPLSSRECIQWTMSLYLVQPTSGCSLEFRASMSVKFQKEVGNLLPLGVLVEGTTLSLLLHFSKSQLSGRHKPAMLSRLGGIGIRPGTLDTVEKLPVPSFLGWHLSHSSGPNTNHYGYVQAAQTTERQWTWHSTALHSDPCSVSD